MVSSQSCHSPVSHLQSDITRNERTKTIKRICRTESRSNVYNEEQHFYVDI